jgi:adenosylcobinamide-GDP ribazoletransferase
VQNLTRFPVGNPPFDPALSGRATAFFPLVGLFIGAVWVSLFYAGNLLWPPAVTAALMVVGGLVATGGMHLDGLMDTLDGLGGRDTAHRLEIMRDSRVGAFGVMGAASALLLRFVLFVSLAGEAWRVLLLAPVISRCSLVWVIFVFPYARTEGQGSAYKAYTGRRETAAATAAGLLLAGIIGGGAGIVLLVVLVAAGLLLGRLFCRLFGGLTGDNYGAVNEIVEMMVLAGGLILVN